MIKDIIPADNQSPAVNRDIVLDVDELAFKTDITGDQAQDLIDLIGTDSEAREQPARSRKRQ